MLPTRTLDELLAMVEREPSLTHVLVEGDFDADLVNHYLDLHGCKGCVAYCVNDIEIDSALLKDLGLSNGNRQRVVAAIAESERQGAGSHIFGIIDADLDRWLRFDPPQRSLLVTDGASMEMYLLSPRAIGTFTRLLTKENPLPQWLVSAVQKCFLIRCAHARLGLPLDWIEPTKSCEVRSGAIAFDAADFLKRLLATNKQYVRRDAIAQLIQDWEKLLSGDLRSEANFHDIVSFMAWHFQRKKMAWAKDCDHLARAWMSCLDWSELRGEPMFVELERRIATAAACLHEKATQR